MSREQAAGMFLRYGCDAQGLLPYEVFAAKLKGSPARLLALEPHQKVICVVLSGPWVTWYVSTAEAPCAKTHNDLSTAAKLHLLGKQLTSGIC